VSKTLTERFAFSGGRVDRAAGTISDCLICGAVSENGRDYPWGGALKGAHTKYEGAPSDCDHGEPGVERRLGWFTNVTPGPDGRPRGTYHLLKSHPLYERVMEAAERNPKLFGFSHVVEAETAKRNGREVVESITKVISVDLVAQPATTRGFFEHRSGTVTTLRAVLESLRGQLPTERQPAARKLLLLSEEHAPTAALLDAEVNEPTATEAAEAVDGAFREATHTLLDGVFAEDAKPQALTAVQEAVKQWQTLSGKVAEPTPAPDSPTRLGLAALMKECKDKGLEATGDDLAILSEMASPEARGLYIERAKKAATSAETPTATGRDGARKRLPVSNQQKTVHW